MSEMAPPPGTGQMKPGARTVYATTADANFVASTGSRAISFTKEDARVTYNGPSTASRAAGPVMLSVQVKDMTTVDPVADPRPGDIRNAQVQFIDRGTNTVLATVNVTGSDPSIGTATYAWTPPSAKAYTIGFIVTNYYTRNNTAENLPVTVTP